MKKLTIKNETIITGNLIIEQGENIKYPNLINVRGDIDLGENAKLDAPLLATSDCILLGENAKLDANITKTLNYKSIDNTMFVIESEKSVKGFKLMYGYIVLSFNKGIIEKKVCVVAEKDKFYAHGETSKQAIKDVSHKIFTETIKKQPINSDTVITKEIYHMVTGACQTGIELWCEQNGLNMESILAKDVYPILEKQNAYAFDKFKQLCEIGKGWDFTMKKLTELEKIERQTQVGTLVMIILWCIAIVGIIFLFHKFELF